ncbi:SDR family NAD(P)-dependent oxidoreductase [Nonomuraea sp. JJY05]|uniref:SDR family NAD(P)-dependent oxidoreductase n=1 Tax=Nonomuraea sp. JJY05 TaxID=3350255 RepID=UPI00373F2FC4
MSTDQRDSGRPLALVTGASAGIGYQLALLFARNGYDLVATGRSDSIDRAAADFEQHGAHVVPVRADLSERDGVQVVWQAVQDTGRPLEAAVLNAGRSIGGAFLDTDLDDELDLLALNITSVVALAKPVARHMADHGNGKILITSSLSATLPTPYETVYGPSRAFTYMFAEALRQEMKDRAPGVTVTALLLPGATDSNSTPAPAWATPPSAPAPRRTAASRSPPRATAPSWPAETTSSAETCVRNSPP